MVAPQLCRQRPAGPLSFPSPAPRTCTTNAAELAGQRRGGSRAKEGRGGQRGAGRESPWTWRQGEGSKAKEGRGGTLDCGIAC